MKQALSFDDVLLVPKYSDIKSRTEVSTTRYLDDNSKFALSLPVISSPMDTITETSMASTMSEAGGLGIIHRYNSIEEQCELVAKVVGRKGAAIGMTGDYLERAVSLVDAGAEALCVDVAHGHHSKMKWCIKSLKDRLGSSVHLIAGNVATLAGFEALASWGADSIRVGIGGGSICSTRLVTGHGIPTFQSILDCSQTSYSTRIIADGGIRTSGDIVKAIAAGADFVMVGSILAGTNDTPGEIFKGENGKRYKVYRGMASAAAQSAWRGKSSSPEGISTTVPYKGKTMQTLKSIHGGIKSGFSYSGCKSFMEFQSQSEFIKQTNAGQAESFTHILRK